MVRSSSAGSTSLILVRFAIGGSLAGDLLEEILLACLIYFSSELSDYEEVYFLLLILYGFSAGFYFWLTYDFYSLSYLEPLS
jgi:hypothetical protein